MIAVSAVLTVCVQNYRSRQVSPVYRVLNTNNIDSMIRTLAAEQGLTNINRDASVSGLGHFNMVTELSSQDYAIPEDVRTPIKTQVLGLIHKSLRTAAERLKTRRLIATLSRSSTFAETGKD